MTGAKNRQSLRRVWLFIAGCLILPMCSGCWGSDVELGTVTGKVTIAGEPQEGIWINFMPDPDSGTPGGMSTAVTDAQGRFELAYDPVPNTKGAVVGTHRIVLNDFRAENFRGGGRPPRSRISEKFMLAVQTPIIVEVNAGNQEIDIELNEYK